MLLEEVFRVILNSCTFESVQEVTLSSTGGFIVQFSGIQTFCAKVEHLSGSQMFYACC